MKLNDLKLNDEGVISNVWANDNIKKRLMDIGFVRGVKIKPVLISKTIRAYNIKNTIISVRNKDTEDIEVNL